MLSCFRPHVYYYRGTHKTINSTVVRTAAFASGNHPSRLQPGGVFIYIFIRIWAETLVSPERMAPGTFVHFDGTTRAYTCKPIRPHPSQDSCTRPVVGQAPYQPRSRSPRDGFACALEISCRLLSSLDPDRRALAWPLARKAKGPHWVENGARKRRRGRRRPKHTSLDTTTGLRWRTRMHLYLPQRAIEGLECEDEA